MDTLERLSMKSANSNNDIYYHASTMVVKKPQWDYCPPDKQKETRDFGEGFYFCKNDSSYPIRLYSKYNDQIILNKYTFDDTGLKTYILRDDVIWLLTVACHRSDLSDFKKYHHIRDAVREIISAYDLILGTISDDRFFSTADAFLDGTYTDFMALQIAQMMDFGKQYVIKSEKDCDRLQYIGYDVIGLDAILPVREQRLSDEENMKELVANKRDELRPYDSGQSIYQILRGLENAEIKSWLEQ